MTKFVPCRSCASKPGPKPGFFYITYPKSKQKGVMECECHKQFVLQETLAYKAAEANIWPEAFRYNIDTEYVGSRSLKDVKRLKKYAYEFPSFKDKLVYMWGPNGTQKTTLAHWVGATVLHQGYSVHYLLMQSLLMTISGFERDEERQADKQAYIEKLKTVDLLIVDESFSKDKVTLYESGYQLPFLDRFIRERFEMKRKGIIFVSNKPAADIEKQKFSHSIKDFVERNAREPHGALLLFEDNYMSTKLDFDPGSLFD